VQELCGTGKGANIDRPVRSTEVSGPCTHRGVIPLKEKYSLFRVVQALRVTVVWGSQDF